MSSYVRARYGKKELGIFAAICSFESFRHAVEEQKLCQLLGMNLLSFEKYLRDKNVQIRATGPPDRMGRGLYSGSRRVGEYTDDPLSTNTGLLVKRLRALYPEADLLVSQPLVQVVGGRDVDHLLTVIDLDKLQSDVIDKLSTESAELLNTELNNYTTASAATGEELINKYNTVEALHQLIVSMRVNAVMVGDEGDLPFTQNKEEYEETLEGRGEDRSLRWYLPRGRIPDRDMDIFETFYEDREVLVSKDKREMRVKGNSKLATEELGLEPAPCWFDTLTKEALESGEVMRPEEENQDPVSEEEEPTPPAKATSSKAKNPVNQGNGVGAPREPYPGADAGVEHVVKYIDRDVSKMSAKELEVCWYGFTGGKKYLKDASKEAQARVVRAVKAGVHPGDFVIYLIAKGLGRIVSRALPPLTDNQLAQMAGGAVVKRKSLFKLRV